MKGRGRVVWLTGLPASGKTTLGKALEARLRSVGVACVRLDGDELRRGLCADLGFTAEDRAENVRRAGEVARILCDAQVVVIVSLISPIAADRGRVRERFALGEFAEVFVDCPLDVCQGRDPKGLYARARAGTLTGLTGVGAPYEPPSAPELHLQTATLAVDSCVEQVVGWLRQPKS